jgi:organic radical activating enzyme
MKTYKINEIFYSLQGEGRFTGWPVVFVRFSGCNRKCTVALNGFDCDTEHESGNWLSGQEIVDSVLSTGEGVRRVILTGGEPLAFVDEELLDLFHENDFTIHVETNGSILPRFTDKIDWLTVSPKDDKSWILKFGNELKVVYIGQDLEKYYSSDFEFYFLQPASMKNIQETIEVVKKHPKWKLSFQQQKILNIR